MGATTPAAFKDRTDAGRTLAVQLARLRREAPVVLAVPRGGVPVAAEVAAALAAPLDILVVHKLGEPGGHFGAVAEGGLAVVDHARATALGIGSEALSTMRDRAAEAADADARRLRSGVARRDVVGRTVILVDDGLDTGNSAIAAARTARRRGAGRIVLATPVAAAAALSRLGEEVDELVCVEVAAAARWYERAATSSDAEINAALRAGGPRLGPELHVPEAARGLILTAGAGELVCRRFRTMGFAVCELPTDSGAEAFEHATELLAKRPAVRFLGVGYFGFGPAADAALRAASRTGVRAVVTAGGRPDRADAALTDLTAATLLIVGGEDRLLVRLARASSRRLAATERQVAVVAGAGHDFAEPGALAQVAHLGGAWFARHL